MNRVLPFLLVGLLFPLSLFAQAPLKTPETSKLFKPWTDPVSGVKNYVLDQRVAPFQLSFYFTNLSYTKDGRYFWFYCAFPPSEGRVLGVIDFAKDEIHTYPETRFSDASPLVDLDNGDVYWFSDRVLYKRGPAPEAKVVKVNSLPFGKGQFSKRNSTHLTFNATKTTVNVDANFGNDWIIGELPLDGSNFIEWQRFDRCYNHAQFNPKDPELQLIAQDWWLDPITGKNHPYTNRLWTIRKGGTAQPVYPDTHPQAKHHGHEWWSASGKRLYYVNYRLGTEYYDLETKEQVNVWKGGNCHSFCDTTESYFVGDIGTYSWAKSGCRVTFFNKKTGKELNLVSSLPVMDPPREYHSDPHPQFCRDDQYICYTTTVTGTPTVAFARTEDLVAATK